MPRSWIFIIPCVAFMSGCFYPAVDFDSPEPSQRLRATLRAAKEKDQTAIPKLIRCLNSDDPALRMAAIRTLEELTGQTLGYDYAAPEWKRREQVRAWVQWNNQRQTPERAPEKAPAKPSQTDGGNADTVPKSVK